jgi:hypothetical protein
MELNLQNLHGKKVSVELRRHGVYLRSVVKLHFQPSSSRNKCFGWSDDMKSFAEFPIEDVKRIAVVPDQMEKVIELK